MSAAAYVHQARRAAAISQRELSRRAGVPQSAIARIEGGLQDPRADTLERLLKACGFELRVGPAPSHGPPGSGLRAPLADSIQADRAPGT